MKTLKNFFALILFLNLIVSCTADDITEDTDLNSVENYIQATGGEDNEDVDKTDKG